MSFYGKWETWKIVYNPPVGSPLRNAGGYGVAFVEAGDYQHAMYTFQQQYAGEYFTVDSCTKLIESK